MAEKTFVNKHIYPLSVTGPDGAPRTVPPNGKITGDFYERFVSPKLLSYDVPAPAPKSFVSPAPVPVVDNAKRYLDLTANEWKRLISSDDIKKQFPQITRGQLHGLVEFLAIPVVDGDRDALIRNIKAAVVPMPLS